MKRFIGQSPEPTWAKEIQEVDSVMECRARVKIGIYTSEGIKHLSDVYFWHMDAAYRAIPSLQQLQKGDPLLKGEYGWINLEVQALGCLEDKRVAIHMGHFSLDV